MVDKLVFATEPVLKNMWLHLQADFSETLQDPDFMAEERQIVRNWNTRGIREIEPLTCYRTSPARFKRRAQLNNLFKRVLFKRDKYEPDQLLEMTQDKFIATQVRLCEHEWKPKPLRAQLVLQKARVIIRNILKDISEDDLLERFEFGKKAAAGLPKKLAYIDTRVGNAITGSLHHIAYFKEYLSSDPLLDRAFQSCTPMALDRFLECDSLDLVCVPKSWKILRSIMPNTIAGGCYTLALGRLIEERLLDHGLDIKHLSDLHKILAQRASKSRHLATADLSSASDSIVWSLLCWLLPRKWLRFIKAGRVSSFTIGSKRFYQHSFCTMGVGFTFPLQTLLYYAILRAIQEFVSIPGRISVFGDDLIYPSKMHGFTRAIFTDLGFLLNDDKTFVQQYFRESCGGDFYHGVDVRPYMPEHSACDMTPSKYLAFLYKTYNGLLLRWDETEIPSTLEYLQRRILQVSGTIYQVPPHFPDTSGVRVLEPRSSQDNLWSPVYRRTGPIALHDRSKGSGVGDFIFSHLGTTSNRRSIWWAYPYLWMALRKKKEDDRCSGKGYNSSIQFYLDQRALRYAHQQSMVLKSWMQPPKAAMLKVRRVKCRPWKSPYGVRFNHREVQTCDEFASISYKTRTGTTDCWAEAFVLDD